jgi:hypothetical protein
MTRTLNSTHEEARVLKDPKSEREIEEEKK